MREIVFMGTVNLSVASKHFKHFHVTPYALGNVIDLRLRIPMGPYQDEDGFVIEDEVTPRACVSTSIVKCFKALADGDEPINGWHVYASNNLSVVKPFGPWAPNGYGPDFSWTKYAHENKINTLAHSKRTETFRMLVPDAENNEEYWVVDENSNRKMFLIGVVDGYDRLRQNDFLYSTIRVAA